MDGVPEVSTETKKATFSNVDIRVLVAPVSIVQRYTCINRIEAKDVVKLNVFRRQVPAQYLRNTPLLH